MRTFTEDFKYQDNQIYYKAFTTKNGVEVPTKYAIYI